MSEPDSPQPTVQDPQQVAEVNQQPAPADAAPVTTPQPPTQPADGTPQTDAQPASSPYDEWDEDTIRFTGTAYLIAQRDGITPEEAAQRLGNLLGSPDVVAQAKAERDAAAQAEQQKQAQVQQAVSEINNKIQELQSLLGQ